MGYMKILHSKVDLRRTEGVDAVSGMGVGGCRGYQGVCSGAMTETRQSINSIKQAVYPTLGAELGKAICCITDGNKTSGQKVEVCFVR